MRCHSGSGQVVVKFVILCVDSQRVCSVITLGNQDKDLGGVSQSGVGLVIGSRMKWSFTLLNP